MELRAEFELACPVLKHNVAEPSHSVIETGPGFPVQFAPACWTSGTEFISTVAQVLEIQERKESSAHESRFFSHRTGSKHRGDGRLRQQELCETTDHADYQQDQRTRRPD